uniref:Protein kinase-like domain, phloem protein 2-like protein n=1 Tax=Tanacetum cinerariifolium TaxID=118510 RepID=A0A699I696_TANCI|nr:protein kinase-like domain, phloem protein 2-like protein [Tanacetum cinerariifolium]
MSAVVENLKMALNCQELLHFKPSEYEQIIQAADPPLIYKSNLELIQTLTKGVRVNDGKTMLLMNEKGENCERVYIEACLDQIQYDRLEYPSGSENSRFPGGRCYCKHKDELKFPSDHTTADFEINFEKFVNGCELQVAGFEFQPLEEKVELHDQGLEEYQDIVKAASHLCSTNLLRSLKSFSL